MPTDNRATAERIARETYASLFAFEFNHLPPEVRANLTAYVLAGMAHRDRTAEREAITDERMQAAWDEAYRRVKSPNGLKVEWAEHRPVDIAWHREFIAAFLGLAAEFDAGERVTLSDVSVVTLSGCGNYLVVTSHSEPPRTWRVDQWRHVPHTGADFDAVKRLAEQRGAER